MLWAILGFAPIQHELSELSISNLKQQGKCSSGFLLGHWFPQTVSPHFCCGKLLVSVFVHLVSLVSSTAPCFLISLGDFRSTEDFSVV